MQNARIFHAGMLRKSMQPAHLLAKPHHNRILHRDKDACFIPNSARIGNAHSWSIGKQLHVLPPFLSTIPVIELNNSAWFPVPFKPAEAGHICVLWSSACQKQACPNAGPVGQQDHHITLHKDHIYGCGCSSQHD